MFRTSKTKNDNIGLIELIDVCDQSCAHELQDYLNTCLDHTRCFQLINIKQKCCFVSSCARVMCDFIERGGEIRLFNISHQFKWILETEKKDKVIKVYDETDAGNAVSIFAKEISSIEDKTKNGLQARQCIRVNTNFPVEFNYHLGQNGVLSARVKVLNLSQNGMLVNHVSVSNHEKGDTTDFPISAMQELNDIKFQLEDDTDYIKTDGLCVWITERDNRLSAGVLFKKLGSDHKAMIRNFISNHC